MTTNKKTAPLATGTASNTAITSRHSTPQQDPLVSWYALAKNAKAKAMKSWRHGKQRGLIDPYILAMLALLIVIAALIVGGVIHA